jgi:hypothetical protein
LHSRDIRLLILVGIIFFIIYSFLPLTTPAKFVSPDENINLFFSKLYAKNGTLTYTEELNEIASGIIHPRNTVYINGHVAPGSFCGMYVIYGTFGTLDDSLVLYLTPLIAVIGVLLFYSLVKIYFDRKIAMISSLLLFVLPPYWYYASRTMFSNILALVFVLAGMLYLSRGVLGSENSGMASKSYPNFILAGLFLGLSLFTRLDYILVVAPFIAIMLIKLLKERQFTARISHLLVLLVSMTIPLLAFFVLNKDIYGGYFVLLSHITFSGEAILNAAPWGFSVTLMTKNFVKFILTVVAMWTVIALLGVIHQLRISRKREQSKVNVYMMFWFLISMVTCFYYLGANFYGADQSFLFPSLSASYVRYLLPLYVLGVPFVAVFLGKLKDKVFARVILITLVVISFIQVIAIDGQSLSYLYMKQRDYMSENDRLAQITEPDSVILCQYLDKLIFPERRVGCFSELAQQPDLLADICINLVEKDIPVYVIEDMPFDVEGLMEALAKRGYELSEIEASMWRVQAVT